MSRWTRAALVAGALALVPLVPARGDDDVTRALAALKAVKKLGQNNEDVGPAWKALVSKGGAALMPALAAFDDANPTANNWLRSAVDAIVQKEADAGRKPPAEELEAFAKNTKFAPSARFAAYELLVAQDATAKDRLLPVFLNDKSADLRRAAVARDLELIDKLARPTAKVAAEALFGYARDKDQVDALAKKIGDTGGKVSVSEHFGFVTHARLVGPFDSTAGKGFAVAYPPERAKEPTGAFKGKNDADVKWIDASTSDKYAQFDLNKLLGKHKDAVGYAFAVVVADTETPVDVRVTSITAVRIFLNGKELYAREEYHHGAPFDASVGKGTLQKGENVLVLKVCQNNQQEAWAQNWFFQMRVCDDTGGPLPLKQKTADGKLVPLGFIANPVEEKEEKK
jgi:hypothetical protein